jgi:hypothetical protein
MLAYSLKKAGQYFGIFIVIYPWGEKIGFCSFCDGVPLKMKLKMDDAPVYHG